jgi:hypothetical protein
VAVENKDTPATLLAMLNVILIFVKDCKETNKKTKPKMDSWQVLKCLLCSPLEEMYAALF